nr:DUF4189 domain-containing protein [Rhizobium sp. L1K21]
MAFSIGANGQIGHGADMAREQAEMRSMQFCGDASCRVTNVTQEACQAVASVGNSYWYGAGQSKNAAEMQARSHCQAGSNGGTCTIGYSYCRN